MNMSLSSLSSSLAEKRKKAKRVAARKLYRVRVIFVYFILGNKWGCSEVEERRREREGERE